VNEPLGTIKIINAERSLLKINFSEIWSRRELLYFLVWKEIKIRYKQTSVGALWAIIQPVLTMIVFTIIFGGFVKIDTGGIPYPIFVYPGLLLWTYFSSALTSSYGSMVVNSNLLSKVYFPRILLPLSACIVPLVDFGVASAILIVLMVYFNFSIALGLLLTVPILLLTVLLAAGIGFWLSAISAKYRDIYFIVPFFIQILLYATPIIYPLNIADKGLQQILLLNPLTGIIDAERAFVLGTPIVDWLPLAMSVFITLLVFITGVLYFTYYEKDITDVI
jgi:lipopolysaccharide transport system permease protein